MNCTLSCKSKWVFPRSTSWEHAHIHKAHTEAVTEDQRLHLAEGMGVVQMEVRRAARVVKEVCEVQKSAGG